MPKAKERQKAQLRHYSRAQVWFKRQGALRLGTGFKPKKARCFLEAVLGPGFQSNPVQTQVRYAIKKW